MEVFMSLQLKLLKLFVRVKYIGMG